MPRKSNPNMKKPIKNLAKAFLRRALSNSLQPSSAHEHHALRELLETIRSLPVIDSTGLAPSESFWTENRNEVRNRILTLNPREFLQWPVVEQTMFVNYASYTVSELLYLKSRVDWKSRWAPAIVESRVGRPLRYGYNPLRYLKLPRSSGNLIHHAYHVSRFEEETGREVKNLNLVVEFGGGYGSMCRLFHNLGFNGKYIIYDLPEFSAIQRYYLTTLGLRVEKPSTPSFRADASISCVSDLGQLDPQILGNGSLFVATWSLSESPLRLREAISAIAGGFDAYLIAYQERFNEVDNVAYFQLWKESLPQIKWVQLRIEHIKSENYYLFGSSKVPAALPVRTQCH